MEEPTKLEGISPREPSKAEEEAVEITEEELALLAEVGLEEPRSKETRFKRSTVY
jgi:hypothetical protein